jgi:acyl carrier protein
MTSLEAELKTLIIESLNLEGVDIDDIDSDEALFVEGLGLDSIDALELGVALQKKYGVKVDTKTEDVRTHFASVRNLASFVQRSLGSN